MEKLSSYKTKEKNSSVSRNRKKEKRDKRIYEKGAVFESIFTESKNLTKNESYQIIIFLIRNEEANLKILKIIEKREQTEVENTEKEEKKQT